MKSEAPFKKPLMSPRGHAFPWTHLKGSVLKQGSLSQGSRSIHSNAQTRSCLHKSELLCCPIPFYDLVLLLPGFSHACIDGQLHIPAEAD